MYGDPLILVLVLALGSLSFFAGVVYVFCRVVGMIAHGFLRLFGWDDGGAVPLARRPRAGAAVCPRSGCRQVEYRSARYCGRCGARLAPFENFSD